MKPSNNRYAVVLSGGSGTRLWPLSRRLRPKQLLALNGEKTILQQTAIRLSHHIDPSNLFTVTQEDYKLEVAAQLAELFPEAVANILAEPCSKNTLPAIAWGTYQIYQQDPEALIGVFASDHSIDNEAAFLSAWETAEQAAEQDYLVLLGIKPHEPATGYGYIKPTQALAINATMPIHQVEQFVEKPDLAYAEEYVRDGYLWNSGMFVFKAHKFMEFLQQYQPLIYKEILRLTPENLSELYNQLPSLSIDYGLAEPLVQAAAKVAVVPINMSWSDLGSWDSIYERHVKDSHNNSIHGDVVCLDTQNSLIWTETGLIAALGLDNLVVIQTTDATLICDRSRVEDVKELVAEVKVSQPALTEIHQTVFRPWGTYTVLQEGRNFKTKRISVNPGAKLSLQMHNHRSEHWVVVSGVATITINDVESTLQENESTYIRRMQKHRLENRSEKLLEIIEVQCGNYLGEDDIVRFEDQYGRIAK
tara:strand:+ start:3962 stop:5389 length:1428 start_codon:yes stop_codon:yes gene_type:complete